MAVRPGTKQERGARETLPETHGPGGAAEVVLDPRVVLTGMFSVAVWISTGLSLLSASIWVLVLALTVVFLRQRLGRRIPSYGRLMAWSALMGVVTVGLYLVFASAETGIRGGSGFGRFDSGVALTGTRMGVRLFAFVLLGMVVAAVSSPLSLASGLTRLLRPLKTLGVPVESVYYFAFFLLRMVPFLVSEARMIRLAQASRGAPHRGRWGGGIRGAAALVIPVLAAAGRRSERLSMALAARGFDVSRFPSAANQLRLGLRDRAAAILILGGWGLWVLVRVQPLEWGV